MNTIIHITSEDGKTINCFLHGNARDIIDALESSLATVLIRTLKPGNGMLDGVSDSAVRIFKHAMQQQKEEAAHDNRSTH